MKKQKKKPICHPLGEALLVASLAAIAAVIVTAVIGGLLSLIVYLIF